MSEFDNSRKIANETLEKGTAAAEQMARSFERSGTAAAEKMREYNLKIIDMAHANKYRGSLRAGSPTRGRPDALRNYRTVDISRSKTIRDVQRTDQRPDSSRSEDR